MLACWQNTTSDRATFKDIINEMRQMLATCSNDGHQEEGDFVHLGNLSFESEEGARARYVRSPEHRVLANVRTVLANEASKCRRQSETSFKGDGETYLPLQGLEATIYAGDEFAPAPSWKSNQDRQQSQLPQLNPASMPQDAGYVCITDVPPSLLYSNPQVLVAGIDTLLISSIIYGSRLVHGPWNPHGSLTSAHLA